MWNQVRNCEQEVDTSDKKILSRLDSLQFGKWHLFVAIALGLVWIFDGYEMSFAAFNHLVTAYQLGCIFGSITFGILAFTIGRRKIFLTTLFLYFIGVLFSGIQTGQFMFILSRFITGLSVGGEFTAIFTAVDQFLPPQYRGRVNIAIDGTWHLGGTVASLLTMLVGQTQHWRLMFLIGWVGLVSLVLMRRNVPQSPRWLLLKGRNQQASDIIFSIQRAIKQSQILTIQPSKTYQTQQNHYSSQKSFGDYFFQILNLLKEAIMQHTQKFLVSFSLIYCQAFFFNQVYYGYPDTLSEKFGMNQSQISKYMLPISITSFVSTILIGPLFDKIGRRILILATYMSSAILVLASQQVSQFFWRQTVMVLIFLFASPAASSANLIASQIFPTSSRTIVLFIMFIMSMLGGMSGILVNNYYVSALLMAFAGMMGFCFCPDSQNKTLQQIQKL